MNTKYVDSNVFIYPVLFADAKAERCRAILKQIVDHELTAVTNVLTWDEFVYIVQRVLGRAVAVAEGQKFLQFPHLTFLRTDVTLLMKAQRLLSEYNIRPRDAIHAATALAYGTREIVSDDSDFDAIKVIRRIPVV
jgi:predicted nucleic acid-binding protein